jgi:GH25 family lysozyme M1 (1,4-beta-N-acetylmuramidase)
MRIPKVLHTSTALAVVASLLVTTAGCSSSSTASIDLNGTANTAVAIDANATSTDAFPENPSEELPDKVLDSLPDSSTYVSPDYVREKDGTLVSATSGKEITDPKIVGTEDTPPDPLAKTGGKSFIPVRVEDVRDAVDDADSGMASSGVNSADSADTSGNAAAATTTGSVVNASTASTASGTASVTQAKLQNNKYGAYWGTYNGSAAFFQKGGSLFAQQAKGVIDVSVWQGTINWSKAKAAGVQGAIIRIGSGQNIWDSQAKRNISECKRLGIPFGIYLYSYAYNSSFASGEGSDLVKMLKSVGIRGKTSYPIFYDLEGFSWAGHKTPTSPSVYNGIVNNWYSKLTAAGYTNLGVYSYTSYLKTALNSSSIHSKTRWVADYGPKMGYTSFPTNDRGWQYSSSGKISGISGEVDLNAFGVAKAASTGVALSKYPLVTLPSGRYYINAYLKDSSSISTKSGATGDSVAMELRGGNGATYQQFDFSRQSDGSYTIKNVHSGKMLDVKGGKAKNNVVVQQYRSNGSKCQRWFIRDTGSGYVLQSALGNWALDISSGKTANGTKVQLYTPNATGSQKFGFASVTTIPTGVKLRMNAKTSKTVVVDNPGASLKNDVQMQLYSWNATDAQLWKFAKVGNGVYTVKNAKSGKALEVAGNSTKIKTKVQQYSSNGSTAQHWMIRTAGAGVYRLVGSGSGKALDIPSGNLVSKAKLRTYTVNSSTAQTFNFVVSYTAAQLANAHKGDVKDGTYVIKAATNAKYVAEVSKASRANKGNVRLYTSNGTKAQKWKLTHVSGGYVTLTNLNSGKVLDVYSGKNQIAANVDQYASNGSTAQKWIAIARSGKITLVSAINPNLVLDLAGGKVKLRTNIRLYSSNQSGAQQWVFQKS